DCPHSTVDETSRPIIAAPCRAGKLHTVADSETHRPIGCFKHVIRAEATATLVRVAQSHIEFGNIGVGVGKDEPHFARVGRSILCPPYDKRLERLFLPALPPYRALLGEN